MRGQALAAATTWQSLSRQVQPRVRADSKSFHRLFLSERRELVGCTFYIRRLLGEILTSIV